MYSASVREENCLSAVSPTHQQLPRDRRPSARTHLSYPRCRCRPSLVRRETTSGRGGPPLPPSGGPSAGPWAQQLESWSPWEGSGNPGSASLGSTALDLCRAPRSAHAAPGRQREKKGGIRGIRESGSKRGRASSDGWRTRKKQGIK